MTIDETIKVCEENAEKIGGSPQSDYHASWYKQVAEWLRELKELSLQQNAPRLGSIEEYHYELAKCKAAFWSCNRRCMDAEEQYRRKADELRKAQEQISEYKRLLKWISVHDSLPSDNKPYAVVTKNNGLGVSRLMGRNKLEWTLFGEPVLYWLPLPEPPKDGDPE